MMIRKYQSGVYRYGGEITPRGGVNDQVIDVVQNKNYLSYAKLERWTGKNRNTIRWDGVLTLQCSQMDEMGGGTKPLICLWVSDQISQSSRWQHWIGEDCCWSRKLKVYAALEAWSWWNSSEKHRQGLYQWFPNLWRGVFKKCSKKIVSGMSVLYDHRTWGK